MVSVAQGFDDGWERGLARRYLIGLPCVLYAMFSLPLRSFGELPLLVAVASAGAAVVATGSFRLPRRYAPFFVFSFSILVLSLAGAMPAAWTEHRETGAALRQWFYVPALPILVIYFSGLFVAYWKEITRHAGLIFLVLFAFSRIGQSLHRGDPTGTGPPGTFDPLTDVFIYAFTNDAAFVALAFLVFLFRRTRHIVVDLGLIIAMLLFSSSSQSQVMWLGVAAIRMTLYPRVFTTLASLAILAFILVAPLLIASLKSLDHNSAVRAILWRDTQEALVETNGIGVGYGTEFIKNRFEEIMPWGWHIGAGPSDMFVATHSAFYDILLREGVIGLTLFAWWFFGYLLVPRSYSLANVRLASAVGFLLVINNTVNVGLSSVAFLFGSAATIALLAALRLIEGRDDASNRAI